MAEFPLEQIKIGDDTYKIAAGGGPNIYKCTINTGANFFDLPRSVGSLDNLKVGDIIFYEGNSFNMMGIMKFITIDFSFAQKRKLNVVNAGGETGFLPGTRAISLMVTDVTSEAVNVYLSMLNIQEKIEMGFPQYGGTDIEGAARIIMNSIGGGNCSQFSGLKPEVMRKVGEIWRPVDIEDSWAVYDSLGKLAYIINEYDWNDIWGLKSFQYNGSANGFVSAVLATDYTQGGNYVYYDTNVGCDVWYPESGNRLYQISNSAYNFGGKYAFFGMNGYTFG